MMKQADANQSSRATYSNIHMFKKKNAAALGVPNEKNSSYIKNDQLSFLGDKSLKSKRDRLATIKQQDPAFFMSGELDPARFRKGNHQDEKIDLTRKTSNYERDSILKKERKSTKKMGKGKAEKPCNCVIF